ncbi:MAG: hypothetical protein HY063_01400 [Bacteroidetes bacterium]|nr:hypothetical protein [Bacteroidota bacterium]
MEYRLRTAEGSRSVSPDLIGTSTTSKPGSTTLSLTSTTQERMGLHPFGRSTALFFISNIRERSSTVLSFTNTTEWKSSTIFLLMDIHPFGTSTVSEQSNTTLSFSNTTHARSSIPLCSINVKKLYLLFTFFADSISLLIPSKKTSLIPEAFHSFFMQRS